MGRGDKPKDERAEERLLTAREVADLLAVCKDTVYALVRQSGLPAIRVGSMLRFSRRDVLSWVELRKEER